MPDGDAEFVEIEARVEPDALFVDVDGFEGPLDLLLQLARNQKVDLRKISVLALAEQYLLFIERAKSLRIELAADYLVLAAWLTFLKSRLLLPRDPDDEGQSGEELQRILRSSSNVWPRCGTPRPGSWHGIRRAGTSLCAAFRKT